MKLDFANSIVARHIKVDLCNQLISFLTFILDASDSVFLAHLSYAQDEGLWSLCTSSVCQHFQETSSEATEPVLAYSWARPAILVAGKGREVMFLFLLFLYFHSCSSFFPVPLFHLFYISSVSFLPFSGRRHKMTHKGWRVVKPQHNQYSNFIWSLLWLEERKIAKMVTFHWPRWQPCPYMVKTIFSRTEDALGLNLCTNHRGREVYQSC